MVAMKNGCFKERLLWRMVAMENGCYGEWLLRKMVAKVFVS